MYAGTWYPPVAGGKSRNLSGEDSFYLPQAMRSMLDSVGSLFGLLRRTFSGYVGCTLTVQQAFEPHWLFRLCDYIGYGPRYA